MGRGGGPGVVRGQITVRGLRTSLGGRRERRGEIEGGGEGGVWSRRVGVGGVGIEGGGRERGLDPGTKLVLLVESRGKLVRGERGRMVVGRADGMKAVCCGIRLGEPGRVVGVEGGKRSATRVGEMMILERMDWR